MGTVAIAVAGFLGVLTRYGIQTIAAPWVALGWPVATFAINLSGSFLLGILAGGGPRLGLSSLQSTALGVGFLGGFTTFSAFSLETVTLLQAGRWGIALLYAFLSPLLGVGLAFLGWNLAK